MLEATAMSESAVDMAMANITLLDGSPVPPGIPPATVAYIVNNLSVIYGAIVFGGMFDALLTGIALHQFACWLGQSRRNETKWTSALVYYLMLIVLAHSGYTLAFMMHTFAFGFGDIRPYFDFKWASTYYLFEALQMPPVEAFFAYRAWVLWGRPKSFLILFPTMVAALFVLCILLQVFALQGYTTHDFTIVLYCWVVLLLVLEMLVSSLIVTAILKGSRTGFRKTDKLMKKVAVVAVQAQIFPILGALAFAIRKLAWPMNPSGWMFLGMPKVWPIAILSVLNSKYKIRLELEKERDRRQHTFDLGLAPKTEGTAETMDVSAFIRAEQVSPTITYPQTSVPPTIYFAPDELPTRSRSPGDEHEEELVGVVGELQYVEEDLGVRRRSTVKSLSDKDEKLKHRRRSSAL